MVIIIYICFHLKIHSDETIGTNQIWITIVAYSWLVLTLSMIDRHYIINGNHKRTKSLQSVTIKIKEYTFSNRLY